jgi:pimeloyl-ACP methyl ester carboxylesterase
MALNQIISIVDKKIKELKEKYGKVVLLGKSFGGFAAVLHQLKHNDAKALILLAPSVYIDSKDTVYSKLENNLSQMKIEELNLPGKDFRKISVPVLLVHSKDDHLVPIRNSEELAKLFPNCKTVWFETGQHSYSGMQDIVVGKIAEWLETLEK